ncbi:hypothetical protein BOTBODRAFT_100151 [Botryobasidium botryosum FD-172 SS1]|uniref:SET domain-containing protein n=1 Tax=Botryobasidium botryosum (strain FD-172 SS1) TaxID=930990 RepID=A0A067MY06_BOTB1|nr:hypothetical protein BOTBODRAFT_100151 [Botryobasidium botryosum FD-172 SS1]
MLPHDCTPPPHWPSESVTYINRARYAHSLPAEITSELKRSGSASNSSDEARPSSKSKPPVVIRTITSPDHPAYNQRGLFASKKILPRTFILPYYGEIHSDTRSQSDYDLSLFRSPSTGLSVGVDAAKMGNEARFVNDYRGTDAKRANAEFREGWDGVRRMEVWSGSEGIKKGEEILVSYGKGWWHARLGDQGDGEASSAPT